MIIAILSALCQAAFACFFASLFFAAIMGPELAYQVRFRPELRGRLFVLLAIAGTMYFSTLIKGGS